jgi:hypothetical protein
MSMFPPNFFAVIILNPILLFKCSSAKGYVAWLGFLYNGDIVQKVCLVTKDSSGVFLEVVEEPDVVLKKTILICSSC